jgi:hypothetical protein
MKRNHIHLAQGVAGEGVISGEPHLLSLAATTRFTSRHAKELPNIDIRGCTKGT